MTDIVERLRTPIKAEAIYNHLAALRKQTRSDLPWLAFMCEMEGVDEERAEAAATIESLRAELAEAREIIALLMETAADFTENDQATHKRAAAYLERTGK